MAVEKGCTIDVDSAPTRKDAFTLQTSGSSLTSLFDCTGYVSRQHETSLFDSAAAGLHAGAVYQGVQRCASRDNKLLVRILQVTNEDSYLCGYLTIFDLLAENTTLSTFFEGELIRTVSDFTTKRWETTSEIDTKHWEQFPEYRDESIKLDWDSCVFMRWKELFMVPDHRISEVAGASYAGFYYMCLRPKSGTIEGFYYHRSCELFQRVNLVLHQGRDSALSVVN